MLNDILTKEYIIQNGLEFEEYLEYGGPYDLGIVEYTDDGKEKLFTGLAYDKLKPLKEEFKNEQRAFLPKVQLRNTFELEEIRFVAGVDLAYWELNGKTYGTCCIVVIDFSTHEVVEKVYSYGEITIPYISGFLAFRELPLIKAAAKKLTKQPDIYMFDGNGYLHYRHMGIATHASFYLNKPTIGVAKSYLKIKGVDFTMPENQEGSYTDIIINNEIYDLYSTSEYDNETH